MPLQALILSLEIPLSTLVRERKERGGEGKEEEKRGRVKEKVASCGGGSGSLEEMR